MFKIVEKSRLNKSVKKIVIQAADIAKKALPGQFVVLLINQKGERIPLTIAEADKEKGLISVIFQEVGFTTVKLGGLSIGDNILGILGPLGHAAEIKKYGKVVCIGGGVGVAEVLPVAGALKDAQNTTIGIVGARTKDLIILEEQMRSVCNKLYLTTDDGSYGQKGLVTDVLDGLLKDNVDLVYAIGPVAMMAAVSKLTLKYKVKTRVCLNPIMVDGTGMCGSCRVSVAGKVKFCCVDGPDFDGHKVDFEELQQRLKLFEKQETLVKEI